MKPSIYIMRTKATVRANTPNPLAPFLMPAPVKMGAAGTLGPVRLGDTPDDMEVELVELLGP